MAASAPAIELEVGERLVRISNPAKVLFPTRGETKLDLVNYYLAVADGIVRALHERPTQLRRFPDGVEGEQIYQKRVPEKRPDWIEVARVRFPSGRHADELCVTEVAQVAWAANLGTIDFHPWPSRRSDVDHPDERRIEPLWTFPEVRRCALAFAREVEQRLPKLVTTAWWKEERGRRVFIDYNQNARDRTIASAYSVRARPDATVSAPVTWEELPDVETEDFTLATMPERFGKLGDVQAGIDDAVCDLQKLFEWVERDEKEGIGEAPYPPQFRKMPGEPKRVQPSRARSEEDKQTTSKARRPSRPKR